MNNHTFFTVFFWSLVVVATACFFRWRRPGDPTLTPPLLIAAVFAAFTVMQMNWASFDTASGKLAQAVVIFPIWVVLLYVGQIAAQREGSRSFWTGLPEPKPVRPRIIAAIAGGLVCFAYILVAQTLLPTLHSKEQMHASVFSGGSTAVVFGIVSVLKSDLTYVGVVPVLLKRLLRPSERAWCGLVLICAMIRPLLLAITTGISAPGIFIDWVPPSVLLILIGRRYGMISTCAAGVSYRLLLFAMPGH